MSIRSLLPVILLTAILCSPSSSQAQQFHETVLHLQEPVVNVSSVDRVIYRWSTFQDVGMVTEFDLEDLVLELRGPEGVVYIDHIITNGVAQPFSGQPRIIGGGFDIFWQFNLTTSELEQMANVSKSVMGASTGRHFDVHDSISIPDDGRVSVKQYIDGQNQDPHTDQLDIQTTALMVFFDDFETGDMSEWSFASP